jgi:hypothetical protein
MKADVWRGMSVHALRSWTVWWLALFGLWVVMEGTNEAMELAAGAGSAALGATLAEFARRQGLLAYAPQLRWLVRIWRLPWRLLYEFTVVAAAIPSRGARSAWAAMPFPRSGPRPVAAGDRAAALVLENVTPNTMVAGVDTEDHVALKHDLVPDRGTTALPS